MHAMMMCATTVMLFRHAHVAIFKSVGTHLRTSGELALRPQIAVADSRLTCELLIATPIRVD